MDVNYMEEQSLQQVNKDLDRWLVLNEADGRYAVDRQVFTNPVVFDLEMKHIFERNWVFLAHESQIAQPHDFLTAYIGREAVLLTRDHAGEVKCFINACAHRGARLCREKSGNRKNFTCTFHGWVFNTSGDLLDVADEARGGYSPQFKRENMGLVPVARLESYRGFIFASLSPDVQSLTDYLAGATTFIDLLADQSPNGELEVLRGATRYTYRGNWKLQAENGLDGYHVNAVHGNYFMTVSRRVSGASSNKTIAIDFGTWDTLEGGSFSFDNGHAVLWNDYPNFRDRPNYAMLDELKSRCGETQAKWMNGRIRNLLLYPNVFLMDQTSTQIRIIRPISVDMTEVTTYCIAPVGESVKARANRIRQYEDFFNASGMATPDDLSEFNNCQIAFGHASGRMNDMSRGATRLVKGVSETGKSINVNAVASGLRVDDEGLYVAIHSDWLKRMKAAVNEDMAALADSQTMKAAE